MMYLDFIEVWLGQNSIRRPVSSGGTSISPWSMPRSVIFEAEEKSASFPPRALVHRFTFQALVDVVLVQLEFLTVSGVYGVHARHPESLCVA